VHKSAGGAVPGTKRQRGGLSWVADVPAVTAVPEGPAGAELAVVLEFMQVPPQSASQAAHCMAAPPAQCWLQRGAWR
jgi:hypothetical protein